MANNVLWLDGVVGSQLRDTQGEMLSVDGADISDLAAGRGRWNDNHGKGFFNSIGRITFAKKVFKEEDCDDDRQKYYWDKVKAPYIYAKGYLYNDEEHVNAKAAAAILRNIHKADAPLKLKASVEGGVVSRGLKDPSLLAQTKIHSVALTFTPANQATLIEPLNLDKSSYDEEADMLLIKSVMHLAETNVPSFRHIERVASAEKITKNVYKIKEMLSKMKDDEMCIPMDEFKEEHDRLIDTLSKPTKKKLKREKKEQKEELEDLDKGIKGLATGAALAGALAGSPLKAEMQRAPTMQMDPMKITATPSASHEDMIGYVKKKNPALWAIAQHESSGGKNLNHKTMDRGMHKGHTAGGPWALMPNTVAHVLSLSPKLSQKYPEIAEQAKDIGNNHKAITEILNKNPAVSYDFAKTLYNHLNKAHKGNRDKTFHSWYHGLGGTKKKFRRSGKNSIINDDYVSKVNQHYLKTKPKYVKKALTAGYGGASAPMSRVGGGVLMTEKLDDGRSGFKYIVCEHCGNEQIYGKNQVKCRQPDCNKSFSMASLYKVMFGSKR